MGGIANLVSPPAPIGHHSAHLRQRPIMHIARPCSSSSSISLTRRSCTRSLTHQFSIPLTCRGEDRKLGGGRHEHDYGSLSDAILSASGGDDGVPFGGGSGGGGAGGGGGNEGNSDEDNMSQLAVPLQQLQLKRKSLRLDQTLEILTLRGHQILRKLLAELEKVPVFQNVIGFLTSVPQDAMLRALGPVFFVKENTECSLGASSSSMVHDNLQCTSSTDPSSSGAAVSSHMDVDGSYSSDNNNDNESIRPVLYSHSSFDSYAATNMGPRSSHMMRNVATIPRPMDISSGRIAFEENENKKVQGFLVPINSVTTKLFTASLALAIATYAYPLTPKASLSSGDPWMQVITAGSTIALVASIILACLGSRLKGRNSIQGAGFRTVKWLILLHPLVLATGICIFLHFALKLSNAVAWLVGAISYIAILFIWAWIYYVDHPEIIEGMRSSSVEDGSFSSPV